MRRSTFAASGYVLIPLIAGRAQPWAAGRGPAANGTGAMKPLKVIVYRVLEVAVYVVTYVVLGVLVFKLVASLF